MQAPVGHQHGGPRQRDHCGDTKDTEAEGLKEEEGGLRQNSSGPLLLVKDPSTRIVRYKKRAVLTDSVRDCDC